MNFQAFIRSLVLGVGVLLVGARASNSLPIPSTGLYLGLWPNPNLTGGPERDIETREGPPPLGINHAIPLHLIYYQWSDIAALLDNKGVFQPDAAMAGNIAHGRVPVISWKCDQAGPNSNHLIAGGDANEDALITASAHALKQYPGPVMLRWFWEFNQLDKNQSCRGYAGGKPAAQVYNDFIAAWRHIYTLFQNAGATNVVFVWNPGAYTPGANDDPHSYYPGNTYVDWIAIDVYQRGTTDTFVDDFDQFYSDFSQSAYAGKPLMAGENGSANFAINAQETQAPYLASVLAALQANRYPLLKAYDYFDGGGVNTQGATVNWVLDDNNGRGDGGLAALATMAASGVFGPIAIQAVTPPTISKIANAEGEAATIAPNTWVEIKGANLAGTTRIWQGSDFTNNRMPTQLDDVSVTVNGNPAYVYYISPTQINILTPPDALTASPQMVVTNNGTPSAPFTAQAQPISPSFFVFDIQHVAAVHLNGDLVGAASLSVPGYTFSPAKPGEIIQVYANGFGPTSTPVVSGAMTQGGTLSPLPVIKIGGITATVQFAGLVFPGEFQFNVVVPPNSSAGDQSIAATYNGATTQSGTVITITGGVAPTSVTYYVSPAGNDSWSGTLAASNAAKTDGPFATFDRARAAVQALNKTGLTQITVQFRGGVYFLPSTQILGAADSGSSATPILYENYPGESPVFSGGVRVLNWTNTSGNTWKTTLPPSTKYFETLFYNAVRRLRPRLGGSTPLGAYFRVANTVYLNAPGPPAAAPNANCSVFVPGSGWQCFDRFHFSSTDPVTGACKNLAPAPGNPCGQAPGNPAIAGDITVTIWEQFSTSKLRVSCIDTKNQIVYMTGPTGISQSNYTEQGFIGGNRYLVENVEDALTLPGQWFVDHSTTPMTLTYLGNPGENPNNDLVIIPQIPQVLVASNLQYVTFRGLTFEHDNYTLPSTGHVSMELEPDIGAAVSFQNSQHITFDSGVVTQTSGTGLEFIPCINEASPAYCVSTDMNAVVSNNLIQNSAFYDVGVEGIRIGNPFQQADTDANVPQLTTVVNNVVEGYGRVIPAAFGIGQGMGHDNLYTHNDVYDGYHCAISTSQSISLTIKPSGIGNANNIISFNHVYNLLQGIMNDGGSIRIDGGNKVFTAAGNKILNNRIHDVTDASVMDDNGYGGHGIYMDDHTGLVDVENNLVYRVSGDAVYTPHGPAAPNAPNTIRNNILASARLGMISDSGPYKDGVPTTVEQAFIVENNLFFFDRASDSNPPFRAQDGCTYTIGFPFTSFQLFNSNLYWRTDGAFATDPKAFHVQPAAGTGPDAPCSADRTTWTFYTFSQWQQFGEDAHSVVQNPGFANPSYPADDYSLPKGSPGVGFVPFDASQAGRTNTVIKPPWVPAAFPTKTFNPATDY